MVEHVLLTYATRRPFHETPTLPEHAQYDAAKGFWTKHGVPLVNTEEFADDKRVTKKCDLETGEDQKGE